MLTMQTFKHSLLLINDITDNLCPFTYADFLFNYKANECLPDLFEPELFDWHVIRLIST